MSDKRDELQEFQQNPNRTSARLYTDCRPKFTGWGRENARLDGHDLADIFQNAVLIAVLNIESGRLTELVGTLCTYVFGICKNLIQAFQRKRGLTSLPGEELLPIPHDVDRVAPIDAEPHRRHRPRRQSRHDGFTLLTRLAQLRPIFFYGKRGGREQ